MRWERCNRLKPLPALLGGLLLALAGTDAAHANDCRSLLQPGERDAPLSRMAMATWLRRCLNAAALPMAEAERLRQEYAAELAALQFRVDALDSRSTELEAQRFSTTTSLRGTTTVVVGGNAFFGTQDSTLTDTRATYGAGVVNYDQKLILNTSFTGRDLLNIRLRAGDFDSDRNSFGGGGPSRLSELEVAFQEGPTPNLLGINRAYYQFPLGSNLRATVGGRVNQSVMLGLRPTVYPDDTVLDLFTQGGASGAYSSNLGVGAGLIWSQAGLRLSGQYIAGNGQNGSNSGGVFGANAGSSTTVQIGYQGSNWRLAAAAEWLVALDQCRLGPEPHPLRPTGAIHRAGVDQSVMDAGAAVRGRAASGQCHGGSHRPADRGHRPGGGSHAERQQFRRGMVVSGPDHGCDHDDAGPVLAQPPFGGLGADTPAGTALAQLGLLLKTTLHF